MFCRDQLDADLRFRYRNEQLHVPVAAKRDQRQNPLRDEGEWFKRKRPRRDRGAADGRMASCGDNLERLHGNALRRWRTGRQQYRHV